MKLARKFQKLFTAEALESLWDHARRWRHPVDVRPILAGLDSKAWAELRERYPHRQDAPRINRFVEAEHWIPVNVERAQDLWLDRAPPLRILDLGCGPGYFLYVCARLGHSGVGVDLDEQPLFREITALLGVRRVIARIAAQQPLPELGEKFDLVTAHRICFQKTMRDDQGQWLEWNRKDWQFFINDARTRMLRTDGRLLLDFNPRADGCTFFTPEVRDVLVQNGARIFRSKALLAADRTRSAEFKLIRSNGVRR
ncbi:MAG TPA: class I SAM-dependent methyltransferase [Chthoniobacterales bacterium]|nr:class I SAM-dependent methyltransferase [Chthoniobacterales bacterium]